MYRAVWPLLAGLLVAAAFSNAIACQLCPQKTEDTSHCSDKSAAKESQHSINHESAAGVTEPIEQCSHCITHVPAQTNSSWRAVVLNNSSPDIVAAGFYVAAVNTLSSTKPVEIHDHGPPGRSSPRYVLNSTFRI